MARRYSVRMPIAAVALMTILPLGGCYYTQAIRGHLSVMRERRPIAEVIADPAAPEPLKERLKLVQEARQFSIDELHLPDNDSYRSYADIGREYVVWNVFAAPAFSLKPKEWCYLVAGCVAYRGYFAKEDALKEAADLRADGYDVAVGGVAAYSTLGRFADPVLNTMLRWSDSELVATVFHELAHQELYVSGDTEFNESFATAVADIGIERWLTLRGKPAVLERYRKSRALRRSLLQLVQAAKVDLSKLYAMDIDVLEKRRRKQGILEDLSRATGQLFAANGAAESNPLAPPLNNARLISLGLYEGWSSAFDAMFHECSRQIDCFYARARGLADLSADERHNRLRLLTSAN